jgi:hypothetical protein
MTFTTVKVTSNQKYRDTVNGITKTLSTAERFCFGNKYLYSEDLCVSK